MKNECRSREEPETAGMVLLLLLGLSLVACVGLYLSKPTEAEIAQPRREAGGLEHRIVATPEDSPVRMPSKTT